MKTGGAVLSDTKAFASFSVNDLQQAKTFYQDTLGIGVEERPEGLELDVGGGHRVFVYAKPDHQPATFTVLNFPVDNVDETVDQLTAKGIRFEHYDLPGIRTDGRGIARDDRGPTIAWFKDPAGNIFSVLEGMDK